MSNRNLKVPGIPVPRQNADLYPTVTALADAVRTRLGQTQDKAEASPTWKELEGTGIIERARNGAYTSVTQPTQPPIYGDPLLGAPTGVEVIPTYNTILVKWDRVYAEAYGYTEVFRSVITESNPSPQIDDVSVYTRTESPYFTDFVAPKTTVRYWLRHVNRDGQAGPFADLAGHDGTTKVTPLEMLQDYTDEIKNSPNYQFLQSEIGLLETLQRSLEGAGLGTSLQQVLAGADSISDLLAEQSLANALDSQTRTWQTEAHFAKNYARLSGGIHAAVNADEAYVQRISAMESHWENDLGPAIDSKITEYDLVLTGPTGAIATQIDQLQVSYGGTDVSMQEFASVVASEEAGYQAQWGVKTQIGDIQRGVGFFQDGGTGEASFIVDADTFAVTGGGDPEVFPFVIKDGNVVMEKAFMQNAEIYDLLAENVTAKKVDATVYIKSPTIDGGKIIGTEYEGANGKFFVKPDGTMEATNGLFNGRIEADDGFMDYVEIREHCEIFGKLHASNITGDIYSTLIFEEDLSVSSFSTGGEILLGRINIEEAEGFERYFVITGTVLAKIKATNDTSKLDGHLRIRGVDASLSHVVVDGPEGKSAQYRVGTRVPAYGEILTMDDAIHFVVPEDGVGNVDILFVCDGGENLSLGGELWTSGGITVSMYKKGSGLTKVVV